MVAAPINLLQLVKLRARLQRNMASIGHIQGVGIGLRSNHYDYVLEHKPPVPWFEILTDNYLITQSIALDKLDSIRLDYPFVMHGIGLSIGSVDPLNQTYLANVKTLIKRYQPAWVSDHLCWSSVQGCYSNELLPLPYTQEALKHIIARVQQVQEFYGHTLLLENISSYIEFKHSEMPEWEFLNLLSKATGCGILLDINNIYVNSVNHHFTASDYLHQLNKNSIIQTHMAGYHQVTDDLLIDTHGSHVTDPVLNLYQQAIQLYGQKPTLLEWDTDVPAFPVLLQEAKTIEKWGRNL